MHQQQNPARLVGLIAIFIGNLSALEKLHGRIALSHALFVCGARLRRCVPADIEMARLFDDGFLLVARDAVDRQRMVRLSRLVARRLSQPVAVSTSAMASDFESRQERWVPQVGVGVLLAAAHENSSIALSMAGEIARTALAYPSRVGCYDEVGGHIRELAPGDPA
jgi:hypothetical protein